MKLEMGESLVYSWLRHVKGCQVVQSNWKVSPQWPLLHEAQLTELMQRSDQHFQQVHGYEIYKKNASLSQLLQQGECDVLGLCLQGGEQRAFAVDVAFHENGLNYGSRQQTVAKVIAKCLRAAMCLYGFLDMSEGEILFAAPKVTPSILSDLAPCLAQVSQLLNRQSLAYAVRLVANEQFHREILEPVVRLSESVADTSELFLRSCQLCRLFDGGRWAPFPAAPDCRS